MLCILTLYVPDYVMAVSYRGNEKNKWLKSWLTSPKFALSGSNCLELDIYTLSSFSIRIGASDNMLLDTSHAIWRSRTGLGRAWHHLFLNMELPPEKMLYHFVFESSYWSGNASYTALIDNVKVYKETCVEPGM